MTFEYRLHREFPADLKADWEELLAGAISPVPFLHYGYLEAWWRHKGAGEWPQAELALVTGWKDGRLAAVAPLFLVEHDGARALMFLGSIELSDYLDFIVREEDLHPFLTGLAGFLEGPDLPSWDRLDLYNVREDSPSLMELEQIAEGKGWGFSQEQAMKAPCLPLPGSWEAYLASLGKKQRHEIRRKLRRMESSGLDHHWYIVKHGPELDGEIEAMLALMADSEEKKAFLQPVRQQFLRDMMRQASGEGRLELAFLEIQGQKAAGFLCFDEFNEVWIYNSGIAPQWGELSPGWVLLARIIAQAIEEGRSAVDFMRGDEEYKYRFGAENRAIQRILITREGSNIKMR